MGSDEAVRTVLVADDERDTVDTTAIMLEECGYAVLRAYSAREALLSLDDHPEIALLVSDIRMPEVDGFVANARFTVLAVSPAAREEIDQFERERLVDLVGVYCEALHGPSGAMAIGSA